MSGYVYCPFCGEGFHGFANTAQAEHPPVTECPLFGRVLAIDQWNMRPPKKEAGSVQVVDNEVTWLRGMVEKLALETPAEYHIDYKPNEATK